MTSKSTWKAHERNTAKLFGSERNPLSGSCGKHSESDSLHPKLFIECEYSSKGGNIVKELKKKRE